MTDTTHKINPPKLGEGIFSAKDISTILKLPYPRVRYWLNEFWNARFSKTHGVLYSFSDKRDKAVNFLTLIEFFTFAKLREKGISAQKIQKIHNTIAKDLNTIYPFARAISTDGNTVWYHHLENLIKADGKKQFSFKSIIEPFLHKIEFGDDKLATRFYPLGKTHQIVIDPKFQFGQPVITGTSIKAETIWLLHTGGETEESISNLYDITKPQVEDAIHYYERKAA